MNEIQTQASGSGSVVHRTCVPLRLLAWGACATAACWGPRRCTATGLLLSNARFQIVFVQYTKRFCF